MRTQAQKNKAQRLRRAQTGNECTRRYEKTPNGFLMRAYRNMRSRIEGVQKKKAYLYAGLELLPKEEFYAWAKPHPEFRRLFEVWVKSGYDRRLTPSVNRIDPSVGYVLSNMEFITHSQNSALSSITKKNNNAQRRAVYAAAGVRLSDGEA